MELYLKITAGLLLFIQAFHLASLQESTDSPGITIDKSWLRDPHRNAAGNSNATGNEEDATTMDSSSGTSSGLYGEDEQNLIGQNKGANETFEDTAEQPEFPDTTVSSTTPTAAPTNSSQINETKAEEESHNSTASPQPSTTILMGKNSTQFSQFSNRTNLPSTTLAPELTNTTGSNRTTTVTKTTTPEINETSTTVSSTTVFPSESTEMSTVTTTAVITPVKANKTDKDAALGSSSERGFASDPPKNQRYVAWAAVLGTAVAVMCVGLVVYIVLKNRRDKGFSHRKLVEDYPSEQVHRLDNNEPLDLTVGGSAYYNPTLRGDNIQMTNFPGRR